MKQEGFKLGNSTKKESIDIDAKEKKIDFKMKNIVSNITSLFEEEKLENISPGWMSKKMRNDYDFLYGFLPRENNKINYKPLVDLLPKHISERWNIQEQRSNISIKDIVDDIVFLFEKEKPEKISPNWIFERLQNDYVILKKILKKDKNGKFDYKPLVDILPKNIAEKWTPFLNLEDIVPKDSYSDSKETDLVVNKHKDNMFLFLNNTDKGEKNKERENIIKDMMEIIMKGNIDTLDRLIDYLVFTVEDWTINDPDNFKVWQYANGKLKDVIKNCIYRYDSSKGNFGTYLYVTLKKRAMDIKIDSSGGSNFKRRYVDGDIEYHENTYDEY